MSQERALVASHFSESRDPSYVGSATWPEYLRNKDGVVALPERNAGKQLQCSTSTCFAIFELIKFMCFGSPLSTTRAG